MSITDATDAYDPSSTILVLHGAELDPRSFLTRVIGEPSSSSSVPDSTTAANDLSDSSDLTPWLIDNKYYTAPVSFKAHSLDRPLPDPHPVVLYLFSGVPESPLPPALTRLSVADPPPDIALAVRLTGSSPGTLTEEHEELFDELGFELVDEGGAPEEDDERPMDPLETVRQTLMTHMWPTMVRKAAGRHAAGPEQRLTSSGLTVPSRPQRAQTMEYATFPVTFAHTGSGTGVEERPAGPVSDFPVEAGYSAVPQDPAHTGEEDVEDHGEDQGYARMEDDEGDFGDFAGPGGDEYARLDEWLDNEAEQDMPVVRDESAQPAFHAAPNGAPVNGSASDSGFEDDFGPGPEEAGAVDANIPLDPTPILLHLQNVRAELADVEDEDERRVRAGAEVARLMQSLGMGGDDLGLDELELDFDGLEAMPEDGLDRLDRPDRLNDL